MGIAVGGNYNVLPEIGNSWQSYFGASHGRVKGKNRVKFGKITDRTTSNECKWLNHATLAIERAAGVVTVTYSIHMIMRLLFSAVTLPLSAVQKHGAPMQDLIPTRAFRANKRHKRTFFGTASIAPARKIRIQALFFQPNELPIVYGVRPQGDGAHHGEVHTIPPNKSTPDHNPDRRLNVRYPVHGSLMLDIEQDRYQARPVNLSFAGIMFKAKRLPPADSLGVLQLIIDGFDETIVAGVRFIWTDADHGAAMFIYPPASLVRCIDWLARGRAKNDHLAQTHA